MPHRSRIRGYHTHLGTEGADVNAGVDFEVGYARAKGKPVLLARTDFRRSRSDNHRARVNLMFYQRRDGVHRGWQRRGDSREG
ncbi:MAG: nucleoside 2-deoxyribosyltransferase [Thermodesulfobacteriota bacterium]